MISYNSQNWMIGFKEERQESKKTIIAGKSNQESSKQIDC